MFNFVQLRHIFLDAALKCGEFPPEKMLYKFCNRIILFYSTNHACPCMVG